MFHKVTAVKPLPDYCLLAVFEGGAKRYYDVKPLFDKWDVFRNLMADGLFDRVRVDTGGYGISWNDDIDLSCDELYWNGRPVQ